MTGRRSADSAGEDRHGLVGRHASGRDIGEQVVGQRGDSHATCDQR